MRSLQLESALSSYFAAAAELLQAELAAGAEVQLDVGSHHGRKGARGTPLYCYRPLTGAFIEEREAALRRLPQYAAAAKLLAGFDGLERYGARSGGDISQAQGRTRVHAAMKALLETVFEEQTDFELRPDRVRRALAGLRGAALAGPSQITLVTSLHGIQISSAQLQLADGLQLARPEAIDGLPDALRAPPDDARANAPLVVLHTLEHDDPSVALEHGQAVLIELLRALRLFGDGRVSLGALAWARMGSGAWAPLASGCGGTRTKGVLLVAAEQEDELRAFCNLVSRRAPRRDEVAWALRRFELGCDRAGPHEALTDFLLALRAMLEPDGPSSAMLAGRLAALCATPEERPALAARVGEAISLERAISAGEAVKQASVRSLAEEISGHLRALLSDVICGHLDRDLVSLADELLLGDRARGAPAADGGDSVEDEDSDGGAGEGDADVLESAARPSLAATR
jgi:hypothetical protein